MALCINPNCPQFNSWEEPQYLQCSTCGSSLILLNNFKAIQSISNNRLSGTVYVVDNGKEKKVLKVLHPRHYKNLRNIQLFCSEVKILKQFDTPHLPKVDCYFQHKTSSGIKLHCILMEKIEGCTLEEWVEQHGSINQEQLLNWLNQMAMILKTLHEKGILHRDIKPHNVMLRNDGQLVLIDLGMARKTHLLSQVYNLITKVPSILRPKVSSDGYIAPEQGNRYCLPQSDFYALGRTLVHLLTGKTPNSPEIYDAKIDKLNWRQCAPHISAEVADLIDQLMASKIGDRPKNAQEILDKITSVSHASQNKYINPLLPNLEY